MNIENIVIRTLVTAGALSFALMAPNATRLLKQLDLSWMEKRDPRLRLRETSHRLRKKGLIRWNAKTDRMELTEKGEKFAAGIHSGLLRIPVPPKWDGRWRIVIFDISEKYRNSRVRLRAVLQQLGFYRLQDSVWIHPFDCEEVVSILKRDLHIGRDILYIVADALENDRYLREHFQLPLNR